MTLFFYLLFVIFGVAGAVVAPLWYFVPALPVDTTSGYCEDHAAACTRNGLIPTAFQVPTSTLGFSAWTPAAAEGAVAALMLPAGWSATLAPPGVQCCVNSLWCSGAPALTCATHGFGDVTYTNYGWTANLTHTPVYTCTSSTLTANITAFALATPRVKAARLVSDAVNYNSPRFQVDGVGFGSSTSILGVQLAGIGCADIDVCHNQCLRCSSSSDCGDDKLCVVVSTSGSFCLRPCNTDNSCPCGGRCYRIPQSANPTQRICANSGIERGEAFCGSGSWRPAPSTGWDSRVECSLPAASENVVNGYPIGPGQTQVSSVVSLQRRRLGYSRGDTVDSPGPGRPNPAEGSVASESGLQFEPLTRQLMSPASGLQSSHHSRSLAQVTVVSRVTGYSPLFGWRYGGLCANQGAVAARLPNLFGVRVTVAGIASTGLGIAQATAAGLALSNPNTAPFSALPYTGVLFAFNFSATECLDDSWCEPIDLCTIPRCVFPADRNVSSTAGGCCVYVQTGACDSALPAPLNGQKPFSAAYVALPRELAAVLPLPPPPRGQGSNFGSAADIADMSVLAPVSNPNSIVWSNFSPWLGAAPFLSRGGGYAFSDAGYGHVFPQPAAPVGFSFPFFGQKVSSLYLSPSGFARVSSSLPCGATFTLASLECDIASGYSGLLGPLVAEFSPGAYQASEVWYASGNMSFELPPGALPDSPSALTFCATWLNLGLESRKVADPNLAPNPDFSSHMCVYGDGAVRWRYGNVLGVPGYVPGQWPARTVVPGGGGPPNASDSPWIAGVRSMSATFRVSTAADLFRQSGGAKYTSKTATSDVYPTTASSATDLLVTGAGVRQGGSAALCAYNPIASASPSCGSDGTTVILQWTPPGCGLGFESLFKRSGTAVIPGQPQLQCMFGGVAVSATVTAAPVNSSLAFHVACLAPPVSAFIGALNTLGAFSVPLQLRIVTVADTSFYSSNISAVVFPQTAASAAAFGVGPSAQSFDPASQQVIVPLAVHGVRAINVPNSTVAWGSPYVALVPHPLTFTYLAPADVIDGVTCGCTQSNRSMADACGVCGGDGLFVDCSGVCFGSAFVDSCEVCVGGTTGSVKNYLMDCTGVCRAPGDPGAGCQDVPSKAVEEEESWTITIIVIVALVTCSFILLLLLAWVALSAHRRRVAYDDAVAEFLAQDERVVRPGLSDEAMAQHPVKPAPTPADGAAPESCAVCMEPMNPGDPCRHLTPCRHYFHVACSDTWLGRSTACPMCRSDLRTATERSAAVNARAIAEARFTQRTGLVVRPLDPGARPPPPEAAAGAPPAAGDDSVSAVLPGVPSPTAATARSAASQGLERGPASAASDGSSGIEMSPLGSRSPLPQSVGRRPPMSAHPPTGSSPRVAGQQGSPLVSSSYSRAGGAGNGPGRVVTPTTISVIGSVHSDGDFTENDQAVLPTHSNPMGGPGRAAPAAAGGRTAASRRSSADSASGLLPGY